jgi:hypothetical protein
MNFIQPYKIYTASNNLEAHAVVDLLQSNGIEAMAVEDNSAVSLYVFGRISQFHQPDVWVEESNTERAAKLIVEFEARKQHRKMSETSGANIQALCESCQNTSEFPASMKGTVQNCQHCDSFVDVGDLEWDFDEDFSEDSEGANTKADAQNDA